MEIVSVQRKRGHLYAVTLDDGQQADIDKTVWEHSGFTAQGAIDDEQWQQLMDASLRYRTRERALYYLSLRDHGSGELRQKLCRAGFPRTIVGETVECLCASGLIDDARYAQTLARNLSERKLYPPRRVGMALREKGFSSDVVEQALLMLPDREVEQALALLYKKRYNGGQDRADRQKALGMLARYGFSYSASRRALERFDEESEEDDED